MRKSLLIFLALAISISSFGFYLNVNASSTKTLIRIDKATIKKGYTVTHDNEKLRFAVTPNQVDQEVNVELMNRSEDEHKIPAGKNLVSNIYSFDMLGIEYNPIITSRPSWIGIKHNSKSEVKKAIYYWDSNQKAWIELPSSPDAENVYIRAITHLPFSKVAVFEDEIAKEIITGQASWFYAPPMTAAMNLYNFGDKVKVTNTENNQSVIVTIDDRGPFVLGRIIDLSSDAFAQIAPLAQGTADVKVEKL